MRIVAVLLLGWVLSGPAVVWAQATRTAGEGETAPGLFQDTLAVQAVQPYVLRPFILPGTEEVYLDGRRLATEAYRLDPRHGRLWLLTPVASADAVLVVRYRTLPFELKEVYRRRHIVEATPEDGAVAVVREEERAGDDDLFAGLNLQRSGSITRGILAGNNRDVTVESGLRLQLSGEIVEGVQIQAALTDENTPILPEGTTQRLDEFDKVFIQIRARQGTAQLGDFDLSFQESAFARLSRKLQGASVEGTLPPVAEAAFAGGRVTVAGATARGIFRVQDLVPVDGVQGPYRLEGAGGERFIIVIPGSEVVYLDGRRLERGETNDYTIDYATGELTFTARRLITADRRIRVEFQYTTNQFTRTLVGSQVVLHFGPQAAGRARARLGATFLREADSRQFEEAFGFTSEDSLRVVQAGDGLAVRSGAEPVVYDPEAPYVQYVREVRPRPGGGLDTVFVAVSVAPPDTVQVFRVRFTRVGAGQGSYVRVGRSVNGILYEYRGPGLGEYEPVRVLPKPKQQRLFDLHGAVAPLPGLELFGEWAHSLNDLNRLSPLDADDDVDHAFLGGLRLDPTPVRIGATTLGEVSGMLQRRFTGGHFAPFDRIRPVEFTRRWNLLGRPADVTGGVAGGEDETVDEADLRFAFTPHSALEVSWGRLDLEETFRGVRRAFALQSGEAGLPEVDYLLEQIESRDALRAEDGRWLRQRGTLRRPFLGERLVPHLELEQERRTQVTAGTDSLVEGSFSFVEWRPGITWQAERLTAGAEVERRTEKRWAAGVLRDAATAWTVQSQVRYRPGTAFSAEGGVGYRVRRFTDYFRIEEKQEDSESVLLHLNADARPWRRAVNVNWFYEAQTERTPTLQEIYVRTGSELGQFVWEDANGDGVIQLDEFIPERLPDEGTYVRTFVPSDSLTSVVSVQARLRLDLDPARLFERHGDAGFWKNVLAGMQARTVVEVLEKSREPDLKQVYFLNLKRFRDPVNTLNGRLRMAQDLSLFRSSTTYGLDLSFNQVRGLTELAAGEETRFLSTWRAEGRYRPADRWQLRLAVSRERNRVLSEAFASRRYDIHRETLEPEVAFQPGRAVRLSAGLALARNDDVLGARHARIVRVPLEARYSRVRRLQVTARVEVARVDLRGEAAGLAAFELTDGRGPGTSFLWNLNGQYVLNRYLRASFSYDGRVPAGAPALHTVRMQLSAVF
ncbi:MAG: hypothetical protein KatS3mg044_1205 [Rhodothermaceae bacterium]|nr:MAG: hypothetical protein KatS3mg044_1205 [Rhodothermaceae bacterium]